MIDVTNNVNTLNSILTNMGRRISGFNAGSLLGTKSDGFSAQLDPKSRLKSSMEDNQQKTGFVNSAKETVHSLREDTTMIAGKVEQIKELAEKAGSGLYSPAEVNQFQADYEDLLDDINVIAEGRGDDLLTDEGADASYRIDFLRTETVESRDFTAEGLGIDNLDLVNDPGAALEAVENAGGETAEHGSRLEHKADVFNKAGENLEISRLGMQAAQAGIATVDAAANMAGLITDKFNADAQTAFIAQANATSESVMDLLWGE